MYIHDSFTEGIDPRWQVTEVGTGRVLSHTGELHLLLEPTAGEAYSNAQISDYTAQRRSFTCQPPLRLSVTAHMRGDPAGVRGTAGFGFWNHPFSPGERGLRLPQALWFFFGSPPSDMRLARGQPGHGWKAATFDARRWQFLALLPAALPGMLLMRLPALYRRLWPVGQWAIGVHESSLPLETLATPHTYTIDWLPDGAVFTVDGRTVLEAETAPGGRLGFVAWLDNQYAVVTPQGRFQFGLLSVPRRQALVLDYVSIAPLSHP